MASEPQTAFFSYSRDDSEFALRLAEDLKAAGANVWMDQLDIAPGQRWARAVQDALNNCQRMLVILSPSSVSSTNVEDEVAFALEEHKTVIPVFYRDCKVPFQLRPFHYVDFRTDYDRGLKTLLRALGVERQAVAAGGAAVSAVPKDIAGDASDADEGKRAAEQEELEQEEKQAAEQARLEKQERQRLVADRPQTGLEPAVPEEVYLDPETRLMWTIQDNGKDIDWHDANQYAGQLRLGGYSDWRLPTIDELEKLSDPQNSSDYRIRKPFRLTSYWVWSSTKQGSGSAWLFLFSYGGRHAAPMNYSEYARALWVRRSADVSDLENTRPAAAERARLEEVPRQAEEVYLDPETRLMWTAQDNGKNIDWHQANQYARQLRLGGFADWRLPTIDELEKLYDPQSSDEYKIRKPFRLTSYWVWSSTKKGSGFGWPFDFLDGGRDASPVVSSTHYRALCVRRSGK